jgi:integrase
MAVKLTELEVKSASVPKRGATTIWDTEIAGFGLRVFALSSRRRRENLPAARSFFLNYRLGGFERRHTIGDWPTWSAAAARERAKELRRDIENGGDPAGEKRERRQAPTVQDLIDRYITEHLPSKTAGGHRTKIAAQRINDEKVMLAEIGHHLGKHTKVADIHAGDIKEMHQKISKSIRRHGPRSVRANRILAIASKLFALSLVPRAGENKPWRDAVAGNPCKGVKRNPEEARERFFSHAELAAISDALAVYGDAAKEPGRTVAKAAADCVRLVMLTGCRPQEAMFAAWKEFDAEPGFWVRPSAHTKQRKVHKLPLSPPAIELIERSRKQHKGGPWVFPGAVPGEPIAAFHHVWSHVRKRAGLGNDARLYDLRHTFASIGAGGGLSLPIIGRLLGHTQARTTQRYAHLGDDPVREAAEKIGKVIAGAGQPGAKLMGIKG